MAFLKENNRIVLLLLLLVLLIINVIECTLNNNNNNSSNETLEEKKVSSLVNALKVFNVEALETQWSMVKSSLSRTCRTQTEDYIHGFNTHEKWALQMEDASGRYTTGWFWGNNFWLGSQTHCHNIASRIKHATTTIYAMQQQLNSSSSGDATTTARNIQRRNAFVGATPPTTTLSPSSAVGYVPGPLDQVILPFPVAFYILKINVHTNLFQSKDKIIHLGLCLPKICTDRDVERMVDITAKQQYSHAINVQIINVKSHNQYYDIWEDSTFRILCGATIAVIILLITGTGYDLYLKKQQKIIKNEATTTTTETLTPPPTTTTAAATTILYDLKHIKLDMNAPDSKVLNGKSATMYVVNNNNIVELEENIDESSSVSDESNPDVTKILSDMLLSFSVVTNWKQICDKSVGSDTISAIHGLRSISMAWVILGHTCIVAFKYSDNMDFRKLIEKEFLFQTVTNGAFSVDTFFFISGLLVSFLYFRTNAKGKLEPLTQGSKGFTAAFLHFVGLISYRFARLTAPYIYVLGIVEVCMKWFHFNSIFEPPAMDHVNCPNYWWRNILYINTLFPMDQMCMIWSWYLSDDTQFFIIGAIILILANSYFKTAGLLLLVLMISSWSTTAYVAFANNHMPNIDDPLALFDKIYDKPWTRLGPYLIGMLVGWILFKTNCRIHMSKLTVLVGWLGSIAILLSLIYGLYETNLTALAGAAYSALSHTAWAIGLAWIVIACSTGHGGFINSILSCTILYPFSRVTYCAYLIHPLVLRCMTMSMDTPLHLGKETMAIMFLGQVVASYGLSFMVSLAFESPVVTMLKILTQFKVKKSH